MEFNLSQQKLKEIFYYDSVTGIFIRKLSTNNRAKIGNIETKHNNEGYIRIYICGKSFLAHRLAWFYVYGEWPSEFIDHENMIRDDNRLKNLREASHSENLYNTIINKNNTSGFKGISFNNKRNKWQATCRYNKKRYFIGYFSDIEEANKAIRKFREKHHGEFANHGQQHC